MKILLIVISVSLISAGCSTTDNIRSTLSSAERDQVYRAKQLTEAAANEARVRAQIDQLQRQLEERKRREDAQAEVKSLLQPTIAERRLSDLAGVLKDANSLLSKRSIYYRYDAFDIEADYQALLEAHAQLLREHPELALRIEGNCDERGSSQYNLALGQRRADSLKRAFTLLGVPAKQIAAVSLGAEMPRVTGHEEQDYAENRRSDLLYAGIDVQN